MVARAGRQVNRGGVSAGCAHTHRPNTSPLTGEAGRGCESHDTARVSHPSPTLPVKGRVQIEAAALTIAHPQLPEAHP
jgi:hypothetical protein